VSRYSQDKLYDLLNNAPLLYGERQNVIRAFRGGVGAIPFYCDGLTGMHATVTNRRAVPCRAE
jgi:hypothetical protein